MIRPFIGEFLCEQKCRNGPENEYDKRHCTLYKWTTNTGRPLESGFLIGGEAEIHALLFFLYKRKVTDAS